MPPAPVFDATYQKIPDAPCSVLLTGSTGFIGRHMASALGSSGYEVTSLQRSEHPVDGVHETIVVPNMSRDHIAPALKGRSFDWLIHLAGYGVRPDERELETMFRVNVDLTRDLVAIAAQWPARAVFIAGSGSEYDLSTGDALISEDHPLEARKMYGASKAAGGICAMAAAGSFRVPLVLGRIFGVFGPGEAPHRLLPSLFRSLSALQRAALSPGLQLRDQLFVEDAVAAIVGITRTAEDHASQFAVNICGGNRVSVRDFARIVADEMSVSEALLGFGDVPQRPDETMCFAGDPTRLMTMTGWRPRYDLRSGIRKSINQLSQSV